MAFEGVSAEGGDGLFPQHPKTSEWFTLAGKAMSPYELSVLESANEGPDRLNQEVSNGVQKWDAFIKPYEPLTRGGGTMAK